MSDVKELVEELRTTANEAESALDLTGFVAGALGWPHDISDSSLRTLLGATLRDFVKFFHEANLFVLVPREAADLLEQQAETIRRLREGQAQASVGDLQDAIDINVQTMAGLANRAKTAEAALAQAEQALRAVEWFNCGAGYAWCPWCRAVYAECDTTRVHDDSCSRQAALRAIAGEP